MNLEQAIAKMLEIIKGAMAAENKWFYLAANVKYFVNAGQVIVTFVMRLFADDRVTVSAGEEAAGIELRSALIDVLDETDNPAIGPAMWITIAQLILKLLLALQQQRN